MPEWTPIWALPNVSVRGPIGTGPICLTNVEDPRVQALAREHPNFNLYLRRFTSAFNRRIRPSIILADNEVIPRERRTVELVASFRDLIAMSIIPYRRAFATKNDLPVNLCFSDTFWCHPWMVSNDYEGMISTTMAQLAWDDVTQFRGQALPSLSQESLGIGDVDTPLLDALMERWRRRYLNRRARWEERALFRSLNMANHAALMPAAADATLYDIGRSIALWVSAFEILTHSGKQHVRLFDVYSLLEKAFQYEKELKDAQYDCYPRGKNHPRRVFTCWLYGELTQARNDFTHGNRIRASRLRIAGTTVSLYQLASPLYRMALTSFLKLKPPGLPKRGSSAALGKAISDHVFYGGPQRTIEGALLKGLRGRRKPIAQSARQQK